MDGRRRIGAVHALLDSIGPTQAAFERRWPEADVAHLLDGSLYLDRSRGTADEEELATRIERLIRYSAATGAEGILFTGSFFGQAVRRARESVRVPVLTSFDGLVERALELGGALHVLSTAADSVKLLTAELESEAGRRGLDTAVSGRLVPGAMEALLGGDPSRHDQLIGDAMNAARPESSVVLAQFSMERVLRPDAPAASRQVLGPASEGVARLRRLLV